jgi:hypothetical protein
MFVYQLSEMSIAAKARLSEFLLRVSEMMEEDQQD